MGKFTDAKGNINTLEQGKFVATSTDDIATRVDGAVQASQDTHDDLNVNANIQVGDVDVSGANPVPVSGTVSVSEPVSVDDNGGSLTVDGSIEATQTTHDDLNVNANLQVGDADVGAGNPVPISDNGGSITVDGTVSVTEPVSIDDNGGSLTVDDGGTTLSIDDGGSSITIDGQSTQGVATTTNILPAGGRDIFTGAAYHIGLNHIGSNIALVTTQSFDTNLRSIQYTQGEGAVYTAPTRPTVTTALNAVVFNATTTRTSSNITHTKYSTIILHISVTTSAGTPTDVVFDVEQSPNGGTTWFPIRWGAHTDLRYSNAMMPVLESVPVDMPMGRLIRVKGTSTGTDASNTFTATVYVEQLSNG